MKDVITSEDLDTLKKAVTEMVKGHYRIQAEKDNHNSIVADIKEKEIMKPKMFRKLAKIAYNDSAKKENQELTDILDIAEGIGIYSHEEDGEQL